MFFKYTCIRLYVKKVYYMNIDNNNINWIIIE